MKSARADTGLRRASKSDLSAQNLKTLNRRVRGGFAENAEQSIDNTGERARLEPRSGVSVQTAQAVSICRKADPAPKGRKNGSCNAA